MIRTHLYFLERGSPGIHEAPGIATVSAAPQAVGLRINHVTVLRVEHKKPDYPAQTKHPPGLAAVMTNIGPGHVTTKQHGIRIVGTDGRMEHRAASARTDDLEIAGTVRTTTDRNQENQCKSKQKQHHPLLSFAFFIVPSPSFWQKCIALSMQRTLASDRGERMAEGDFGEEPPLMISRRSLFPWGFRR